MSKQLNIHEIETYNDLKNLIEKNKYIPLLDRNKTTNKQEIKNLEKKILHKIQMILFDKIIENYSEEEIQLIKTHWIKIFYQACVNIGITPKTLIYQPSLIEEILLELQQIIVAIEAKGISPYDNCEIIPGEDVQNFVKYLLHDISLKKDPLAWKYLKLLFWKKDFQFIQQLRDELQKVLLVLYKQLMQGKHHEEIMDMFIGHVLATYALTEPEESTQIQIPQKINDSWQLIDYMIQPISLTPDILFHPIYAYGLIAFKNNNKAPSLLLFRSTPLPTGKSSLLTMMADFTPGFSIGEILYRMGKKHLKKWIINQKEKTQKLIKVYGQSLGGTMAYHLAIDYPNLVEIHTFVPSGLFKRSLKNDAKIKGKSFSHEYDVVGLINHHPEDIYSLRVLTENPRKNPLKAHFRLFGCDKTILIRINPKKDNKRFIRRIFSIGHQVIAFPLFLIKALIFFPIVFIKVIYEWIQFKRKEHIGY